MGYGPNIKAARKAAGLTQEQLAKKCEMATITIQQYEREVREPRYEQLLTISKVLGVPISRLTDEPIRIEIPMPDYPVRLPSEDELARMAPAEQEYYYLRLLADTAPDQLKKMYNDNYDKLNKLGQVEAVRRTKELSERSQYTDQDPQNKPLVITEVPQDATTQDDTDDK